MKPYKLGSHYAVMSWQKIPLTVIRVNPSREGSVVINTLYVCISWFSYLVLCEDCLATSIFWFNNRGHVEEMASQVQFWPWHYWKAIGSIAKLYKVFIRKGKINLINEYFIHICTWNNSDKGWICIYYIKKR